MAISSQHLIDFILSQADSTLILSQRNSEWCGHGPVLEQDIAITNISLDLLGQSRNFYQYAAQLINSSSNIQGAKVPPLGGFREAMYFLASSPLSPGACPSTGLFKR